MNKNWIVPIYLMIATVEVTYITGLSVILSKLCWNKWSQNKCKRCYLWPAPSPNSYFYTVLSISKTWTQTPGILILHVLTQCMCTTEAYSFPPYNLPFKFSSISPPVQSLHCNAFPKEPKSTAELSQVTSLCCKSLCYIAQWHHMLVPDKERKNLI